MNSIASTSWRFISSSAGSRFSSVCYNSLYCKQHISFANKTSRINQQWTSKCSLKYLVPNNFRFAIVLWKPAIKLHNVLQSERRQRQSDWTIKISVSTSETLGMGSCPLLSSSRASILKVGSKNESSLLPSFSKRKLKWNPITKHEGNEPLKVLCRHLCVFSFFLCLSLHIPFCLLIIHFKLMCPI